MDVTVMGYDGNKHEHLIARGKVTQSLMGIKAS
jgi:hypothetical protein